MDLETKPQVDRLGCCRERPIAAGTAPNSDWLCIIISPLLLGAGALVAVGDFARLLAAERRAAPLVWPQTLRQVLFVVVFLAKC